jgi:hypothetical protein
MTSFMGIDAGNAISGTKTLAVGLSTAFGGVAVGILKIDYDFLQAGTSTVVMTFTSNTSLFSRNIDTTTIANGNYDVRATLTDKRSMAAGGARTASLTRSNVTVANAPIITAQRNSAIVAPAVTANFTLTATNATGFQWRKKWHESYEWGWSYRGSDHGDPAGD